MTSPRVAVVLGASGRLGPAVVRALHAGGWTVRAFSRRLPHDFEGIPTGIEWSTGDRRDVALLGKLVEGATFVFDDIGFDVGDAKALLEAIGCCASPPAHLVFASSVAEYGPRQGSPESVLPLVDPGDAYGRGKRMTRVAYERSFKGPVHSLLLPRLVAPVDAKRRDAPYLEAQRSTGKALVSGDPDTVQVVAPVEGVAGLVLRLANEPARVPSGPLNVGPAKGHALRALVGALLEGAGQPAEVGRHPDPQHRGPHGRGPEPLDTTRLRSLVPDLVWPDVLASVRDHGAWLARTHDASKRPVRVLPLSQRSYEKRRTVDVHGRRRTPALATPRPELQQLAEWVSPAVYVDTGRPCNSACMYCAVPPHGDTRGFAPLAELEEMASRGVTAGCDRAILVGGEPTIYPSLAPLLDSLRRLGLSKHLVMTNGLKLAEPGFLDLLANGGVATLHISVDTADAGVYDKLSRSQGQFPRQLAGFDAALADPRFNVYVYSVVTAMNAAGLDAHLDAIAERSKRLGRPPPPLLLAFTKPVGDAHTNAALLELPPEERGRLARAAVARAEALGLTLGIRNLPACQAPELADRLVDYYLEDFSVDVTTGKPEPYAHNVEHLAPVEACRTCAHAAFCPGVYREEAARFGTTAYRSLDATGLAAR